jgi:glycosyltransferase involved in cell wall biosynthesis
MFKNQLAIIIPAYKALYLVQTLESFAKQTVKDFTIYIGDDNSPDDIEAIAREFNNILDIRYHRFNENLGGRSLTKHWERCVELSNEHWIWLFSDDDLVDDNCVEKFYQYIDSNSKFYKFQTKIIDSNNNWIFRKYDKINSFTESISTEKFIYNRLKCNGFRSFAVEYIFSRDLFDKYKFIEFPLAWSSDDATWFIYSIDQSEIKCIPAFVNWRSSNSNISTSTKDQKINILKIEASLQYCLWLKKTASENNIEIPDERLLHWFSIQIASIDYKLGFKQHHNLIKKLELHVDFISIIKNFIIIQYYHIKNSLYL